MPRTLKRRADAISRDDASPSSSSEAEARPTQQPTSTSTSTSTQRRPHHPSSPSPSPSDPDPDPASQTRTLTKKLVRLALSSEYARQPLRRTDITAKILKSDTGTTSSRVSFRAVFLGAQSVLRDVFGMELVDLPGRERVGLNERRKAVGAKATQAQMQTQRTRDGGEMDGETQTQTQGRRKDAVLSAQNWILVSCLPERYRVRPELMVPSRAPDQGVESAYVALYTVIVGLLYLHTPSGGAESDQKQKEAQGQGQNQSQVGRESADDSTEPMSDAKLHRYLSRLNLSEWAPMGVEGVNVEKLLARMLREGYVEKRRDTGGGEEVVEWVVGPRGKREVGRRGVAGLVRGVYGFGVDGSGKGLEMPRADDGEAEEDADDDYQRRQQQQTRRRPVKMERDELESRLKRTLGDVIALKIQDQIGLVEPEAEVDGEQDGPAQGTRTRRGDRGAAERSAPRQSSRRRQNEDDDDE